MGNTASMEHPRQRRTWMVVIAFIAFIAAIVLLILSTTTEGTARQTGFAAGAAILGAALGFAVPFVRTVFVDSFTRPTRHSVLERRNGDGSEFRVRVVDEPAADAVVHAGR
jgi:hypothetical protein